MPEIVLSNVELKLHGADGTRSHVQADVVSYRRDSGALGARTIVAHVPEGPRVGRGGVSLSAAQAEADVGRRSGRAFGGVTGRTVAGDAGETREASYDGASGTIRGTSPVHLEGPGYSLDAREFAYEVDARRLTLGGGVFAASRDAPGAAR